MESIKAAGICGSPRKGGNTEILVKEALQAAEEVGARVEFIHLGEKEIKFCDGDLDCVKSGECRIKDDGITLKAKRVLAIFLEIER